MTKEIHEALDGKGLIVTVREGREYAVHNRFPNETSAEKWARVVGKKILSNQRRVAEHMGPQRTWSLPEKSTASETMPWNREDLA